MKGRHPARAVVITVLILVAVTAAARAFDTPTTSISRVSSSVEDAGTDHRPAFRPADGRGMPLVPGGDRSDAAAGENRVGLPDRRELPGAPAPPLEGGARSPGNRRSDQRGDAASRSDGIVPAGTTVFDDETPGVANLDPSLLRALRQAAADAADDGVELVVNSGWRSAEYQQRLLEEAVTKYGSEREAARWVASPSTSAHVSGDAVDVGFAATAWLAKYGGDYGLCQIYRNELWHYELRREAIDTGCPAMYADPSHDPGMRQ